MVSPAPSLSPARASAETSFQALLRRLASLALAVVLSVSLVACSGNQAATAPTLSPEAISAITRQAEGFLVARDRLPDLADLVNSRNWVFTRNLIHGPMQE
ncbi:MAG: photosystem II protein PsbQ, partial [Cyanobium sp.]